MIVRINLCIAFYLNKHQSGLEIIHSGWSTPIPAVLTWSKVSCQEVLWWTKMLHCHFSYTLFSENPINVEYQFVCLFTHRSLIFKHFSFFQLSFSEELQEKVYWRIHSEWRKTLQEKNTTIFISSENAFSFTTVCAIVFEIRNWTKFPLFVNVNVEF